ncbi:MAG: signal peptidase II [Bdellovibrionaceae bacterium]|nr:signal peptidase II [Pseudobdellovibrionaceae bacterium]MDW8189700.1 signal peptidase II [Pseudobdellovibrionaceae bacterium]
MDSLAYFKQLRNHHAFSIFILLALIVLPLDQFLKWVARKYLKRDYEFELGPFFVRFELAENPGAFLSLGANWPEEVRFWILTVLVLFILVWAGWTLFSHKNIPRYEFWGLQFLLVGGIGNLIDRAFKGTVTDYIQVGLGPLQTGIFNLVDMMILLALFIMLLGPWWGPKKNDDNMHNIAKN